MFNSVKCVACGDGAVGKTSLLISYATNNFPEDYVPTVFDNYTANLMRNEQCINLQLWDTAGQEEYDKLRPLSYPNTTVFLAIFSVTNPTSMANIESKWAPEIRQHCPTTPIVLVGTKIDTREDVEVMKQLESRGLTPVTKEQGEAMKERIGAAFYWECSAKTQHGLKQLFERVIDVAVGVEDTMSNGRSKKKKTKSLKTEPAAIEGQSDQSVAIAAKKKKKRRRAKCVIV